MSGTDLGLLNPLIIEVDGKGVFCRVYVLVCADAITEDIVEVVVGISISEDLDITGLVVAAVVESIEIVVVTSKSLFSVLFSRWGWKSVHRQWSAH